MIFEEEFQITGRLDWNFRSLWEKLSGKSADYGGGSPQWGHLFFFFAHFFIMAISANLTPFIILNILTIPTIFKSSSSLPSSRFAPSPPFSPLKSSFGEWSGSLDYHFPQHPQKHPVASSCPALPPSSSPYFTTPWARNKNRLQISSAIFLPKKQPY